PGLGDREAVAALDDLGQLLLDELPGGGRRVAIAEARLAGGAQLDDVDRRRVPFGCPVRLGLVGRDCVRGHVDALDARLRALPEDRCAHRPGTNSSIFCLSDCLMNAPRSGSPPTIAFMK